MSFISFISSCWSSSPTQYELLSCSKKDEDFAMTALKVWQESYPVDSELTKLRSEQIKDYVNNLIKDLNKVPITSSNIGLIERHLVEISKQSSRVRRQLLEKSSDIKTDKEWIFLIKEGLIFTYTNKF